MKSAEKFTDTLEPIEKEITPFSRLNSFGTPQIIYNCNSDDLKVDEYKSIRKGDRLNCYFIDPKEIEAERCYLLEHTDNEGKIYNYIRYAKSVDADMVHLVCLNPDKGEDDDFKFNRKDLAKIFTGVARIVSYDREV